MSIKANQLSIFLAGIITGILLLTQLSFKDTDNQKKQEKHKKHQTDLFIDIPEIPDSMSFAAEQVPLDRREVQEAFDRELIYNYNTKGHLTYLLKLSKRYFPMIEKKLRENNVPDDFKYLCVAESNLQNLSSGVGAKGFWQFMKETAPGYNLEVNDNVDERFDPEKSTDAACQYLKFAYAKFGSWTAAAASYNCGIGRYSDLSNFQQTNNYYDLQLPDETNKYIFRILSFKYLLSNTSDLGFDINPSNSYQPVVYKSIAVSSSIPNLAQWAIENGSNYKMLKILNPWLRDRSFIAKSGKTYIIKLPQ